MTGVVLSLVQLVAGVSVLHQPCPGTPRYSCYVPATRTIYLVRSDRHSRFALLHEYGHAYDFDALTDSQRDGFKQLLGYRRSRTWWSEGRFTLAPGEKFANAYADCAMGSWLRVPRLCAKLPPSPYAFLLRAERRGA